jgi:tetratricopeptide (TPR) repeat protein
MESLLRPEEFSYVEELIYQAKFDEALEFLKNTEESAADDSIELLWALILKGKIYCYLEQYKNARRIGETAYLLSQKLETKLETVEALLIKAHIIFLGDMEEAYKVIVDAERILESLNNDSTVDYSRQQADILFLQSHIYRFKGDLDGAFRLAKQCLSIRLDLNKKIDISSVYFLLGLLYLYESDSSLGLDFATKSLEIQEELRNKTGIARALYLVGTSYFVKGNFEKALKLSRECLKIKEISTLTRLEIIDLLSGIYINRGQSERAIRYRKRQAELAHKEGYFEQMIISTYGIGVLYRTTGEYELSTKYLKRGLALSEKFNSPYGIQASLFYLILLNLDNNNIEQVKSYLQQLEEYKDQTSSQVFKNLFLLSKALVLKNSGRIRNLSEAENLLKSFTEREIETPIIYRLALVNLCEIYLEELKFTNDISIIDEINPLINKIYKIAEKQNAHSWLADSKLLEAKLALIQMNFDKTKQLLIQAQRIAELNGLTTLALKISSEHDNLLEQVNEWKNLKNSNAPLSERIKLAAFNRVVDRMQGKSETEPVIIKPAIPVLLLIIGQGGFPLFSYQFEKVYEFEEDLLSGFLAAFNTFSGEVFSKGLDRVKFGEYMMLMQTVDEFSACYLFKGQTYNAKKKLSLFLSNIKHDSSIWDTLEFYYKTSRVVKLENLPSLESLILKIFVE